MTDEARELHRVISGSVRDLLDAYRLQVPSVVRLMLGAFLEAVTTDKRRR